jgi:hypothetical protein
MQAIAVKPKNVNRNVRRGSAEADGAQLEVTSAASCRINGGAPHSRFAIPTSPMPNMVHRIADKPAAKGGFDEVDAQ